MLNAFLSCSWQRDSWWEKTTRKFWSMLPQTCWTGPQEGSGKPRRGCLGGGNVMHKEDYSDPGPHLLHRTTWPQLQGLWAQVRMMRAVPHSCAEVNWLWQSCWAPRGHFQHYFYGKRHFQKWVTEFWNTTSQQVAGNWVGGAVTRGCSQWTVCHHGQLFPDHWINFSSKEEEEEGRRRRRWGKK